MSPSRLLSNPVSKVRRLDQDGLQMLEAAIRDEAVVARYDAKLVLVPGSDCLWWTGAVSGRGHGRFWIASDQVVIAHRFGFALTHGVESVDRVDVLGHRCDNPLCQRIAPGHVEVSTASQNRREWAARIRSGNGPLADRRGARQRAVDLRDLARIEPRLVAEDIETLRLRRGEQQTLW